MSPMELPQQEFCVTPALVQMVNHAKSYIYLLFLSRGVTIHFCVIVVCANDNLKALLTPPSLETTPAPPSNDGAFHTWWNQYLTVPIWVLFLIFPLISIRSPTFFTKFTALGKLSSVLKQACFTRELRNYLLSFFRNRRYCVHPHPHFHEGGSLGSQRGLQQRCLRTLRSM